MDSERGAQRDTYTGEPDPRRRSPKDDVLELGAEYLVESEEGDFTGDAGATDVITVVEDGETYFPPTDPVVAPSTTSPDGLEVRGGFARTSLDEPREARIDPTRLKLNDDEIVENVLN